MRPYAHSIELRKRAVAAYESENKSATEIARLFGVGERSLHRWRVQLRDTGALAPRPHQSGNKARVDEEDARVVHEIVRDQPDASIEELAIFFVERTLKPCSRSAMGRALLRLGLTQKKRR